MAAASEIVSFEWHRIMWFKLNREVHYMLYNRGSEGGGGVKGSRILWRCATNHTSEYILYALIFAFILNLPAETHLRIPTRGDGERNTSDYFQKQYQGGM